MSPLLPQIPCVSRDSHPGSKMPSYGVAVPALRRWGGVFSPHWSCFGGRGLSCSASSPIILTLPHLPMRLLTQWGRWHLAHNHALPPFPFPMPGGSPASSHLHSLACFGPAATVVLTHNGPFPASWVSCTRPVPHPVTSLSCS